MKKIVGPRGQVGGGQQGEVRLNESSVAVGSVCCVRAHMGRVCAFTYSVDVLS